MQGCDRLIIKLVFLSLSIPIFLLLVPNVYAGGPRFDAPEDGTQEERDCYRDGWEQGFAHKYDEDRAEECSELRYDWYNRMWDDACVQSGQTVTDCNNFKEDNNDVEKNNDNLGNENMEACWDDGYEDGQNNPFNQDRNKGCTDYQNMYYKGFIAGCESAGNSEEICDTFTDQ